MRYREIISELFVQPAPLQWMDKSEDRWTAIFSVNDAKYQIDITGGERAGLAFGSVKHGVGISGTGNAATVFATVVVATRAYITKCNPKTVWFMASYSEPSRVRLYDRMASRLIKELPDYKLEFSHKGGEKFYVIVRNDVA